MKPIYQADIILDSFEKLLRAGKTDAKFIMLSAGYEIPPELDTRARTLEKEFDQFVYVAGMASTYGSLRALAAS